MRNSDYDFVQNIYILTFLPRKITPFRWLYIKTVYVGDCEKSRYLYCWVRFRAHKLNFLQPWPSIEEDLIQNPSFWCVLLLLNWKFSSTMVKCWKCFFTQNAFFWFVSEPFCFLNPGKVCNFYKSLTRLCGFLHFEISIIKCAFLNGYFVFKRIVLSALSPKHLLIGSTIYSLTCLSYLFHWYLMPKTINV